MATQIDQDAPMAGSEEIHLLPLEEAVSASPMYEYRRLSASDSPKIQ
jgi:hypothetical protein